MMDQLASLPAAAPAPRPSAAPRSATVPRSSVLRRWSVVVGRPSPAVRRRSSVVSRAAAAALLTALAAFAAGCGVETVAREAPPEAEPELRLLAVGDLMLGGSVSRLILSEGADYPYRPVLPLLREADLLFGNLEGPCSDRGEPTPGKDPEAVAEGRDYLFRAPPEAVTGLAAAGFDLVSLANNHAMDYGAPALLQTLELLEAAGIAAVGAGATLAEARAPVVLERNGVRVAFLAISDVLPRRSVAGASRPGIAPARGWNFEEAMADLLLQAGAAADFVAVSVHWGVELAPEPNERQRTLGRWLIDHGADLVLGHHPHVVQPVERYGRGLIHYSLGDFAGSAYRTRRTEAWEVTLRPGRPPEERSIPLEMRAGQVHPVEGETERKRDGESG